MADIEEVMAAHRAKTSGLALMDWLAGHKWNPYSSLKPNAQAMAKILAEGADVNFRSTRAAHGKGARPLHLAAQWADSDIVARLLAAGAKPGATRTDKKTPLHLLSRNKDAAAIASILLAAGAPVAAPDVEGRQPIGSALGGSEPPNYELGRVLLDAGAPRDAFLDAMGTLLRASIAAKDPSAVSEALAFLAERGESLDSVKNFKRDAMFVLAKAGSIFSSWRDPRDEKELAAQDAADRRAMELFNILLSAGCPVYQKSEALLDDLGRPAPSLVDVGLQSRIPKKLLLAFAQAGAAVDGGNAANAHEAGPARLAVAMDIEALRVAFELGLDKNWRDEQGDGLLAWAMASRYARMVDAVAFLLAEGVDPNVANKAGVSPLACALHHEVESLRAPLVEALLANGASVRELFVDGVKILPAFASAVETKISWRHTGFRGGLTAETARMLAQAGASIDDVEVRGVPLLVAAGGWQRQILILHGGASPSVAFSYWGAKASAADIERERLFTVAQIDQWAKWGAKPSDMLACLRAVESRLGSSVAGGGAPEAYLEALELRESCEKTSAPSLKSMRL